MITGIQIDGKISVLIAELFILSDVRQVIGREIAMESSQSLVLEKGIVVVGGDVETGTGGVVSGGADDESIVSRWIVW